MAVTIGNLAIQISAQTDPLARDMKRATKLVADGTKAAKEAADRTSMWGNWFRFAFLASQVKKLIGVVRQGTQALKDSGVAGAEAAEQGLAQYDAAMKRISGTVARSFAPALGAIAQGLGKATDAVADLIDVYQYDVFGDGLDKELARRDMEERNYAKRKAEREQEKREIERWNEALKRFSSSWASLDPISEHFRYAAEVEEFSRKGMYGLDVALNLIKADAEKTRSSIGLMLDVTPVQAYEKQLNRINNAFATGFIWQAEASDLIWQAWDKLLTQLGAAEEVDPFQKWNESINVFRDMLNKSAISFDDFQQAASGLTENLLKAQGLAVDSSFKTFTNKFELIRNLIKNAAIDGERAAQLVGAQIQQIAEAQQKVAPPQALIRGSSAEFSARNELARREQKADASKIVAQAAAKAEAQRAEQIRLGNQLLKATERQFVVMGP